MDLLCVRLYPVVDVHPLVKTYVSTSKPFLELLADADASPDPMVRMLGRLRLATQGELDPQTALAEARAFEIDASADTALTLFFLGFWASVARLVGLESEVRGLLNRMKSFDLTGLPPEVEVTIHYVSGMLAASRADLVAFEATTRDACERVTRSSLRWVDHLIELGMLLAALGRAGEIEEALTEALQRDSYAIRWRVAAIHLTDHAECGRAADAARVSDLFRDAPPAYRQFLRDQLDVPQALAGLLTGRWAPSAARPSGERLDPGWPGVVDLLLAGRTDAALARARAHHSSDAALLDPKFPGFNLIRAELGAGHGLAARRLMARRRDRGTHTPLDDLFLARAAWLLGEPEEAHARFSAAQRSATERDALGRFDLELRAAPELTPSALLALAAAGHGRTVRRPVRPADTEPAMAGRCRRFAARSSGTPPRTRRSWSPGKRAPARSSSRARSTPPARAPPSRSWQ
jgi:hypothetical protein